MIRWWGALSRLTRGLVGLVAVITSLGAPIIGLSTWADGRYFPKTDGERLLSLVHDTQIEVKIGHYITRETGLAKERAELLRARSTRPLTAIEHDRLLDVETQLAGMRERITKLRDKLGKNGGQ